MTAAFSLPDRYLRLVLARIGAFEDDRLRGIRECVEALLERGVPGDLLVVGSPPGEAAVFARALLAANKAFDRWVWLASAADSAPGFTGEREALIACDLLDQQVRFIEGPVAEELLTAPVDRVAFVLLGVEAGASAEDLLAIIYPQVPLGGFVLVDEYDEDVTCRNAVKQFRRTRGIESPLQPFGPGGVVWRKERT